jgi:RHS repeat-associated protein
MKICLFISRKGTATRLSRATAALLTSVIFATAPPFLYAADSLTQEKSTPQPPSSKVLTPRHVSVRRALPKFTPPSQTVKFSANPSDEEITSNLLLAEPLVPIGGKTTAAENQELATALTAFEKRQVRDDFGPLENFLTAHPQSAWNISLLTNLGSLYRKTGWYGKAMDTWKQAWTLGQAVTDADEKGKATIDRALVESIVMNARVGRMDDLASLIKTADGRQLVGSSRERVEAAKQALVLMQKHPETSFRCGPMAVEKLRNMADNNDRSKWKLLSDVSTQQGTSLAQLTKLSSKLSMDMVSAYREPGSAVLAPSVVNWKVGHFAAIVGIENGLIHLADPTFGNDVWISQKALDAEASGYFLVKRQALPTGWKQVSSQEAAKVLGKGQVSGSDDTCNSDKDCKTCHLNAMGGPGAPGRSSYYESEPISQPFLPTGGPSDDGSLLSLPNASIHMMLASLCVEDTPIFYQPPLGPVVDFHMTYSQREAYQPSVFSYSNMGPLWTFNGLSYITDDPNNVGADVTQYLSDGGTLSYTGYVSSTKTYAPQQVTGATLKVIGTTNVGYELDMPDGSVQLFNTANHGNPRNVFMTQTKDPQGNGLTYSYDIIYRLVSIQDALGQVTTLTYGLASDGFKITQVADPFGRTASFAYNADGTLQSCTNMAGMVSTFAYQNGALQAFTTPYGTTTFDIGQDGSKRWDQITDPNGGQERIETWYDATGLVGSAPPQDVPVSGYSVDNTYLQYRNTFYWDKKAMMDAPGNYAQAQLVHWLEELGSTSTMSGEMESYKAPLENRVYYKYTGQPYPYAVGSSSKPIATLRVLDNGTTQVTQEFDVTYNAMGKTLKSTGPPVTGNSAGRITTNAYYSNNIDLQYTYQQNQSGQDTIFSATYNSQHEPLTTTDAAGQTTTYAYSPTNGQITSITDAKNEVKSFGYDGHGYLLTVSDQQTGGSMSYTYDGFGRIRTSTDINGYKLTYDYDSLNRVTVITYPDGTFDQNIYVNLDLTFHKDRLNRRTHYFYNSVEQLVSILDPQGRTTNYDRCACGELLDMTDSYGHRTSWTHDIEGRLVTKTFPDNTQDASTYEPSTSRLLTFTDAKSQTTTYTYNLDDTTSQKAYTFATVATPTVSFTYDPYYPRITQMADGTGSTNYVYNAAGVLGAGRVHLQTSPIPNSGITYTYDQLGRVTTTSINGSTTTVAYDSMNRVQSETDSALSSTPFTYSYYGATPRLQGIAYPDGQSASYSYQQGPNQDFRLTDITNYKTGTTILSKFDYTYNANGTIATWKQQTDSNSPTTWTYQYDQADQLLSAVKNDSNQAVLAQYAYGYDLAGNRTSAQNGLSVKTTSYNNLNQMTGTSNGGPLQFTGALSEPGKVTVGGNAASVDANNNFSGAAGVATGTNVVAVVAMDYSGNASTNKYQVVVPASSSTSPLYDLNGNLKDNNAGQTYEWDAKDELTAINYTGGAVINGITRSEFTYDGLSRRVKIVEKAGTTVSSTKQFVWVGNRMAEERDSSGSVTKRFFALGEQIGSTGYFLTRDHLGSIRELTNASGVIQARYDYDPYGVVSTVGTPTVPSDFQYAGMYEYATSGLNLTKYRAYDPNLGRWLSRDPMGEGEDATLYSYVWNQPVGSTDILGLAKGNTAPFDPNVDQELVNYLTKATTLLPPTPLDDTDFGEFSLFNLVNGNGIKWSAEVLVITPCKKKLLGKLLPEAEAPATELGLLAAAYATIADATYYFNQAISPPPSEPYGDAGLDSGPD